MNDRPETELLSIKQVIEKAKLRWNAETTTVSKLGMDEMKRKLGLIYEKNALNLIDKKQEEKLKKRLAGIRLGAPVLGGPGTYPSEWDWRDVSGVDWTTAIRDQGGCGSCVAFAVLGALEMMIKRWVYNDPATDPTKLDYSEAHLFYCNSRQCDLGDPNFGWWNSVALNCLKANGVPDEACFPYTDHNQPCSPCSDWQDRTFVTKINDWQSITNTDEMKRQLSEHGCLVADFVVYNDFRFYSGGVYEHIYGPKLGGHAVAVVGYSDVDDCWICKNSWGTDWGETEDELPWFDPLSGTIRQGGWFRIAYDECGIDDIMYKMDLVCPAEESATTMGFRSRDIETVRQFRNGLRLTRKGRAYISRAERNIGDVTKIMLLLKKDKKIREMAAKALKPFLSSLDLYLRPRLRLTRPTRLMPINKKDLELASAVLDEIAKADETLRPAVTSIKREMDMLAGKNVLQILREL